MFEICTLIIIPALYAVTISARVNLTSLTVHYVVLFEALLMRAYIFREILTKQVF